MNVPYVKLLGGDPEVVRRINLELRGAVETRALSYWAGTAKNLHLTTSEALTGKYRVTAFTRRLLSVRYDFSVNPVPNETFYLPSVTVTADLATGQVLKAADVFVPAALKSEGLTKLAQRIVDAAPDTGLCPSGTDATLDLKRSDLTGDDGEVNIAFEARTVDFTLVLSRLGEFPAACGHPTIRVPYCVLGGLISPSLTDRLGEHTAYPLPATPLLGEEWVPGQEGYGRSQPCRIFNGGDPTGLVTNVRWHSWGAAQATGEGDALYAPGIVADGRTEPARIVAFDLGMCHGVPAYRSVEWYFPQHGDSFDLDVHLDICTDQPE